MRILSNFVTLFGDESGMVNHNPSIATVSGTAQNLAVVSSVHILIKALSSPKYLANLMEQNQTKL